MGVYGKLHFGFPASFNAFYPTFYPKYFISVLARQLSPWVKEQPPGVCQQAPTPGQAPEWGPGEPRHGEGTLIPLIVLNIKSLMRDQTK